MIDTTSTGQRSGTSSVGKADRLKDLMISDNGFAFDPQTGLTYAVNPTGTNIIRWINDGFGDEEIVQCIQEEYDVDEYTAMRDFKDFWTSLRHNTLV